MTSQAREFQIESSSKQSLNEALTLSWKESLLQRRRAVANSDSESCASRTSLPPPESLLPLPPSNSTHQSCVLKNSNCCYQNSQKLETRLYNTELEEALQSDKMDSMINRLNRTTLLLEASIHYAHCLDMKNRAGLRLSQIACKFINKDLNMKEALEQQMKELNCDKDLQQKLAKIKVNAVENTDIPDHLNQLIEDHKEKRKNYMSASNIYSDYLCKGNHCSNSQLRKLNKQYEIIRAEYAHSRCNLDQEVQKLTNKQLESLECCLMQLSEIQEDVAQKNKQLGLLVKGMSKEIHSVYIDTDPPRNQARHQDKGDEKCSYNSTAKLVRPNSS